LLIIIEVFFNESYLKDFLDHKLNSSGGLNAVGAMELLLIITEFTFLTGIISEPFSLRALHLPD
tara:strand:- start:196 stop:387 length:192 start_codon:yes stop_codon:yes gene_type:complete